MVRIGGGLLIGLGKSSNNNEFKYDGDIWVVQESAVIFDYAKTVDYCANIGMVLPTPRSAVENYLLKEL